MDILRIRNKFLSPTMMFYQLSNWILILINGPQLTACLAKGYINDKYKWTEE